MLDVKNVIKLNKSVNITTNDLILTGSKDIDIEKGIFLDSDTKAIFTCPNEEEAIFKIE